MANVNVYADERRSPLYVDGQLVRSMDRDKAYRLGTETEGLDVWTEGACVLPCNDFAEILLLLRSKTKAAQPRVWLPPVETCNNESLAYCAQRGLKEETGRIANPSELVDLGLEFSIRLADTPRYKINQIQRYFGYKWNGNLDDLKLDSKENEAAKFWPYRQIGTPPLITPLDKRQLGTIAKALRDHGFLPRKRFFGFNLPIL